LKKEFVFSAKFDTSDFDKSVEQMQKKLREIYAPSDMVRAQTQTAQRLQGMGMGGMMSQPTAEGYQRATQQSRREMDQLITEQARGQEKLGKIIAQRGELLKKLQGQQKEMVKDSREELELKEKIARVEENNYRLRESYKQRDQSLNQVIDAKESMRPQGMERLMGAYRGGGLSGVATAGGRMLRADPMGVGGNIAGAAGAAIMGGSEFYRQMAGLPIATEIARGQAVQQTWGRETQNIYGRRTGFEQIFSPEKAKASKMATDKMEANRTADIAMLAGMAAATAGGTMAGGVPGLVAAGGSALAMLAKPKLAALALSPISSTARDYYQSQLEAQRAEDYTQTYEAKKQQNPFKTMAAQQYEQNFMRDLTAQRSMGLSDQGLYGQGGLFKRSIGAGFTPEMGLEMGQGILGAGGSTRGAANAQFGLQMQRGMNMTNAANVLGTISGGVGSGLSTERATIKVLAEGMKLGLDDSKFAEENRRFTQAAAEIIARTGAQTGGEFQRVAEGLGQFVGERTNKGIEAAQSAYQQYQGISSTTTGPRGVMRMAAFMNDPILSQLSTMTRTALMKAILL
jgi:hypothetical protein